MGSSSGLWADASVCTSDRHLFSYTQSIFSISIQSDFALDLDQAAFLGSSCIYFAYFFLTISG